MKTWREVKEKIEAQIEENWLKEPKEMWEVRHGINVTGAGSFNQYFSTMLFVDVYTIAYGQHMFFRFVQCCDDPDISLDVIKKLTRQEITEGFKPTVFMSYVSTPQMHEFAMDIVDVLPQIETKDEYRELMSAYVRYINLVHYWHHCTFPWHVGMMYQYKSKEEIEQMYALRGDMEG